ncbi:MAG: hydroxylamine reductase [Bacteroidales bacterium]|uniref:hydroxylamine reductase n=1 Tax=Porphyromonas sp. TaxID=1924944 RepID=UPI0029750A45|nr:hydroxylamine reductase [Porphyromonas sp.]MDD7437261.1 hydroxylamine reductase [Bacteroidales bacterium]MDY3068024.1 hydroxylamine reductase [Porphyromonas sp.]
MFCYQCQETAHNTGCTLKGVCGKTADVAGIQDFTVYLLRNISLYAQTARKEGKEIPTSVGRYIAESLFMTITNANFDFDRFIVQINKGYTLRNELRDILGRSIESADWESTDRAEIEAKAQEVGVLRTKNEDIRSLREMITYGLKGMAAYVEHAMVLGHEDPEIYAFMEEALVASDIMEDANELTAMTLKTGSFGVKAMALLDNANTSHYGNPEITKVNIGVQKNPGILISGHDLRDLEDLLKQTEGEGIDIYTHSEMLPAHYYPELKKYKHLVGNYGSAWWEQTNDFETFNGVILFTTNCIVPPRKSATYADRVYTTGSSGFPGFKHIPDRKEGEMKDFSELIAHAKKCQAPTEIETGEIVGGFAHNQVIALADKVVEEVKAGNIKQFFVMGGCDGRHKERSYYTDFALGLPKDTIILTAGCAKYRYIKLPLGDINGIPRVLDAGQCNDSYSIVQIAMALKAAFNLEDVNDLPVVINISWYEQKAVIVLLALLSLGFKNIQVGPTLPGYLSPNIGKVLNEAFGLRSIDTVESDLARMAAR